MQTFHIITAKYLPLTETKPSRVRIRSVRFNQTLIVSIDDMVTNTAVKWLKKKGFHIVGIGFIDKEIVIVSDTFKSLK
jgi:hypothetical protein